MSADRESAARSLALALVSSVEPALGLSATPEELENARDAAQVVMLPGLDRSLAACASHAGVPWPEEIVPLVERMRRLMRECAQQGALEPLVSADAELLALAAEVESIEWSDAAAGGAVVATLGLGDVLEDLAVPSINTRDALDSVRLVAPVAAALRAALDWLTNDGQAPHPVEVRVEDSSLTLTFEGIVASGLRPAENVIADVGGSLGPVEPGDDTIAAAPTFMVRVPRHVPRPSYLTLLQGDLRLAIPWHAVLKVRMRSAADRAGASGAPHPMLPRIAATTQPTTEPALVLVAHGLKRAYLCADRLVWRLQATLIETDRVAPVEGLKKEVRTEDGEVYWLAEPRWLLAGIDLPWQAPTSVAREETTPPRVLTRDEVEPLGPSLAMVPGIELEAATEHGADVEHEAETATEAGYEPQNGVEFEARVVSMGTDAPPMEIAPESAAFVPAAVEELAVQPVAASAPIASAAPTVRRDVLIAEDSITARIFLGRMLEQTGATRVHGTRSAAELVEALGGSEWWAILLDVELPDTHAEGDLAALVALVRERAPAAHVVGLIRDPSDLKLAAAVGIVRVLLKPFDRPAVERLMTGLADADNPRT